MGRRPIGKVAMSLAERQRRYREKHDAAFKARIRELEAELAFRKIPIRAAIQRQAESVARLKARISELEAELAQVRKAHHRKDAPKP